MKSNKKLGSSQGKKGKMLKGLKRQAVPDGAQGGMRVKGGMGSKRSKSGRTA